MPEKGDNMLKFNNVQKQLPVPFVIYADFEAITEKNTRMPANQTMMNHILNHIKNITSVHMDIRLSVVMMMNTVNQFRYIKEKIMFISS